MIAPWTVGAALAAGTTVLPVPTIDHTPETGLAGGAVVMVGHAFADSRRSALSLEGTVTARHQRILSLDWAVFAGADRLYTMGGAAWMRYPERYWGIGPHTPEAAGEDYDAKRSELRPALLVRVPGGLYVGPSLLLQSMREVEVKAGGLLDGEVGSEGGQSLGLGAAVAWEGRRDTALPKAGERSLLVEGQGFGPGSDYTFGRLRVDGRGYWGCRAGSSWPGRG